MNKNRGITLIALVITIIVLLILAGISISMLTGENGLLTKASLAKDNTRAGGIQEEINLAVAQNELYNYSEGQKTNKDDLIEKLHDEGKLTDEEYNLLKGTEEVPGVNKITIGTIEVDFSKLESGKSTGLQVGDYVKYGDKLTAKTYTTDTEETGYTETQTFATNTSMLWRVLSVDGDKVELVATQNVLANDDETGLYLKGQKGFLNAETVLEDLCETLYNSTSGTARSIKVDDINNLTNYDPTTYSGYGQSYTYTKGGPFWNKTTNTFINPTSDSPVTVTSDHYNYTTDTSIPLYDTLIAESATYTGDYEETNYPKFYWLGSRCANASDSSANFDVRYVVSGDVFSWHLFNAITDR